MRNPEIVQSTFKKLCQVKLFLSPGIASKTNCFQSPFDKIIEQHLYNTLAPSFRKIERPYLKPPIAEHSMSQNNCVFEHHPHFLL
jgi:hypothetical protein